MSSWGKAIRYGLLVWLIPFVVAFCAFPLKQNWRSLFESIMPLTLTLSVVWCGLMYFRRAQNHSIGEALRLGLLWYALCVAIDLPLMLNPPINYTLIEYAADIGLTYVMIPVITVGLALAARDRVGGMDA